MPAFVSNMPSTPKRFDLIDAISPIDRNIETLQQAAVLALSMVAQMTTDPATGAVYSANTMPRPAYIVSGGGITTYEAAMVAAQTAFTTALTELDSIRTMV